MEEKIVKVLNEMSAYLTIAQMKKLQEIMLDTFAENKIEKGNKERRVYFDAKAKVLIKWSTCARLAQASVYIKMNRVWKVLLFLEYQI